MANLVKRVAACVFILRVPNGGLNNPSFTLKTVTDKNLIIYRFVTTFILFKKAKSLY